MQKEVAFLDIPMCRPVEMGRCEEGVYILQTWIDGKDAEDVVPCLTDPEQYALGIEAGRILKKSILSRPRRDSRTGKCVLMPE